MTLATVTSRVRRVSPRDTAQDYARRVRQRVGITWALLFFNALTFYPGISFLPIPSIIGKGVAQVALPLALVSALTLNRKVFIRPNVLLSLILLLVFGAVLTVIAPEHLGTVFRTARFAGYVVTLWLLTPWWGRRDLLLVRCHLMILGVLLGSTLIGFCVAPGKAMAGGRLGGVIWPLPATQVAHYAAIVIGLVVILWFCGHLRGTATALIVAVSIVILILTHTRTALVGMIAGILVAGLSLIVARPRVRKLFITVGIIATIAVLAFGSFLSTWLARGQGADQLFALTGRTNVWSAIITEPRDTFQEIFGFGLSNSSFNGLPIDSNWLASYQEQGLFGVAICAAMIFFLFANSFFQPRGVQRAMALFLVTYCLIASFTEVGFTDVSPYLLELTIAASLLMPQRESRLPDLRDGEFMIRNIITKNRLLLGAGILGSCALVGLAVITHPPSGGGSSIKPQVSRPTTAPSTGALDAAQEKQICGQRLLRSPYNYHGHAGSYRSGTRGLPTFGHPGTDFPHATGGMVLGTGMNNFLSYQLKPETVYYLLPGKHAGSVQADADDAFVGGFWNGQGSVLTGDYRYGGQAIDSNSSSGDQKNVAIEYLTIENYQPNMDAAAVNQEANTGWTIRYNTIAHNAPGAGVLLGAGNTLTGNCLTENGQYGFQSTDTNGFGKDALTGGPYGVTVTGNEISHNDTCDLSGLLNNPVIGWKNYNPVPARYRSQECEKAVGDGNEGGFKLWQTNGVTISHNYVHDNWGPGAWVDTNNANTTFDGNTITGNEGAAIIEEISYNFSITGNYMANNDWLDGLNNPGFPQAAVYISESGSDTTFGGVPACRESACAGQPSYPRQSVIRGNTLVNNGGNIFLWQSSNRYCSDDSDGVCTLTAGGPKGPFTVSNCKANLPSARADTRTFTGLRTGAGGRDWWDGCLWHTSNVLVTENTIDFDPRRIMDCNSSAWPACGAGGIFSQYGSSPGKEPGWVIPTQLTFFQHDIWSKNTYNGPSVFFAWNQGNGENPITWNEWTGNVLDGDKCGSAGERRSGYCTGAFGQDKGSVYRFSPVS